MAELRVAIGGRQITSIIRARSSQRNAAKAGTDCRSPHKGYRSNDLAGLTHEKATFSTRAIRSAAKCRTGAMPATHDSNGGRKTDCVGEVGHRILAPRQGRDSCIRESWIR